MRSFLTRLVNSVTRAVFLAPCLLICLACATPFPSENLKARMTTEAVREEFGAPKAVEARPGTAESCWTYWHEEQDWFGTFFPLSPVSTLLTALLPWTLWDAHYVQRNSVFLHFEGGELVWWEAIPPTRGICHLEFPGTDAMGKSTLGAGPRIQTECGTLRPPPTCSISWGFEGPTEPIPDLFERKIEDSHP